MVSANRLFTSLYLEKEHNLTMNKIFVLQDGVRSLYNGTNEIRLRKGMWNYDEAEIEIGAFSDNFKDFFHDMIDKFSSKDGFNPELIKRSSLDDEEKTLLNSLISQLESGGYICDINHREINQELSRALLGYSFAGSEYLVSHEASNVIVFTDSSEAKKTAQDLSHLLNLNLTFPDEKVVQDLTDCDLTTKVDGLVTEDILNRLKLDFNKYKVILVCVKNISSKLMHNLNRISLECNIPMVVTFIDGPMISMLSVKPLETGCYECFEARSLARIEDHILFHKFDEYGKGRKMEENPCLIPLMNFLMNIALTECYLYSRYRTSRFEGRLLSIFVPTLEIQVQDILRVPFCPACGFVAYEQLKEKNISSRKFIDDIVTNAISPTIDTN